MEKLQQLREWEQMRAFAELDLLARQQMSEWKSKVKLRDLGREVIETGKGHLPKGFQIEQPLEEEMSVEELCSLPFEAFASAPDRDPQYLDWDGDEGLSSPVAASWQEVA